MKTARQDASTSSSTAEEEASPSSKKMKQNSDSRDEHHPELTSTETDSLMAGDASTQSETAKLSSFFEEIAAFLPSVDQIEATVFLPVSSSGKAPIFYVPHDKFKEAKTKLKEFLSMDLSNLAYSDRLEEAFDAARTLVSSGSGHLSFDQKEILPELRKLKYLCKGFIDKKNQAFKARDSLDTKSELKQRLQKLLIHYRLASEEAEAASSEMKKVEDGLSAVRAQMEKLKAEEESLLKRKETLEETITEVHQAPGSPVCYCKFIES